jgi:hypothetical protein
MLRPWSNPLTGDAAAEERAMKINHLNLTVTDVPAAAGFLSTYFGLKNQGGNAGMTVLTDTEGFDGMILTLMKARPATFGGYPETFHVGFFIADREEVDRLSTRLQADGFAAGPAEDTGHSYGFTSRRPADLPLRWARETNRSMGGLRYAALVLVTLSDGSPPQDGDGSPPRVEGELVGVWSGVVWKGSLPDSLVRRPETRTVEGEQGSCWRGEGPPHAR